MKFDIKHALAGLALLVIGMQMGRRAATRADQAQGSEASTPPQWWTYTDGWN